MTKIKICGLMDIKNLTASLSAGADFIGFVFYPPSPRAISLENALSLAHAIKSPTKLVGLFVNPDDDLLNKVLTHCPLDYIQLHGDESPTRINSIKNNFKKPIIKAVSIATKEDVSAIKNYETVADWILCDTKLPNGISGGSGITFDWSLLDGFKFNKLWMLSGGLTAENVRAAISALNPDAVDVSSGVEIVKGQKDPEKIRDFIKQVRYK